MSEKVKVLIVNDPLQYGGSDMVAVRLQQNLDKDIFECTYCLRHSTEIGPMEADVAKTGVRIIHQSDEELGYFKSYKYYKRLFKSEHFDVVHCHLPFYSAIVCAAAKKCGVKKRVAHSHFSQPLFPGKTKLKRFALALYRSFMRLLLSLTATDIIGCSLEAGVFLAGRRTFKKKGVVLNNGIDLKDYELNREKREKKRAELGVQDKTVIGHIGQMYYVKNHSFLIDVFYEYQKRRENSVLFLISDGPDRQKLEQKADKLGIGDKVRFLGFRTDIPELLAAVDCFVFPSIHEGFPLTLVEAQAAKLPCLVSNTITKTVKLSNALEFCPLNGGAKRWCEKIDALLSLNREEINNQQVYEEFDIKNVTKKLEKIYLS